MHPMIPIPTANEAVAVVPAMFVRGVFVRGVLLPGVLLAGMRSIVDSAVAHGISNACGRDARSAGSEDQRKPGARKWRGTPRGVGSSKQTQLTQLKMAVH